MQRDTEDTARPSLMPDDTVFALRRKSALLQARVKGDVALQRRPNGQQRRSRQLQRLPEGLRAVPQEARHQQARDPQRLYLAHPLSGAARWAVGNKPHSGEPILQGAAGPLRGRQRHKEPLREERSCREVPPGRQAWHTKSLKKATGLERRGAPRAQCLSPPEKRKEKRAPSSQTSGGRQLVESWAGFTTADLERLHPLLAAAVETKFLEEKAKEKAPKRMRQVGNGTDRSAQGPRNYSRASPESQPEDLEQLRPVSSTHRKGSECQRGDKDFWQKELASAVEELFKTSRKLRERLTWHLEQRPVADQNPAGEQVFPERRGPGSDVPGEEGPGQAATVLASEAGSPRTASQCSLPQLPSQAEGAQYHHLAPCTPQGESQTLPPEDRVSVGGEDSILQSPTPATPAEGSPHPRRQEQPDPAGWRASRQKQKTAAEGRKKSLLEQTEHPSMSLEIHYKAELEEERRARRKTRLALLRSYSTGAPARDAGPVCRAHSPLYGSGSVSEEKHSQMVLGFQRQILEQNRLHTQFLEKARKRLREFQKTW
ncbi:protein DDC8 homolog [Fukomys damarensis]|uniref:Protein KIAA1731 n=1 Tax=Fukomys damarensis TaxID=885580 RepID=A0A091EJJ0_FUKDA|nr:protein DDC8 homolog [Fukomys damarensis]XP_010616817.1 protein DDC8 homolog [Fukomys damarensis]XP_010616819.1 protein DDC8 homolog [Fukomys damarensis]XP_033623124.1 protein DDC8 homolog [Fukomys damarensis]KFO35671.1 Protein KIAA1731 [Fukomys damarensis]